MDNIAKETKEHNGGGSNANDNMDPKGEGLEGLGDMFKNFDKIVKEQDKKPTDGDKEKVPPT